MSRVITIVNQKGGVGKTTTAVNVLAYLTKQGKKVLLIDMDPQANATSGVGINPRKVERGVYDVLMGEHLLIDALVNTDYPGFDLAPATIDLAGGVVELVNQENREFKLAQALESVKDDYDYIMIDCPPSLNLLTVNSLVAAKEVLIPVQAEYYALEGLGQLLDTINLVKKGLNQDLKILGAVITMYEERQRLCKEVWLELYKHFPGKIFRSVIPRNVKLAEAPSFGKSIFEHSPRSRGAIAYNRLAREILETEKNKKSFLNKIIDKMGIG